MKASRRQKPETGDDFDGYYQGDIVLPKTGATTRMQNSRMPSFAPYFVYSTRDATIDPVSGMVKVAARGTSHYCTEVGLKDVFDQTDLKFLLEHDIPEKALLPELRQIAESLVAQSRPFQIRREVLETQPFFKDGLLREHSLIVRQPLVTFLWTYLLKNPNDDKQKAAISDLATSELESLAALLKTEPWELVWPNPARSEYGLKNGLETPSMFFRVIAELSCPIKPSPQMEIALRIYFHLSSIREKDKHTIFLRGQCNSFIPCLARDQRAQLEQQVYGILIERAFVWVKEGETLAFRSDYIDAQFAIDNLKRIRDNRAEPIAERPDGRIPVLFPPLTARQAEIAQHIKTHWLTIVEGMPGTGKTALITWIYSKWQNVMLTSFVGSMVKSLQKRNGRRREAAYTIHYLLTVKKYADPEQVLPWLAAFEVLVVDEISNVSMKLFSKLLRVFPNLRKIVLVGDHRQLPPIEEGWPMADLLTVFGSEMLHDNLRVVPELAALQQAPALIVAGNASLINFDPRGPISFLANNQTPEETLLPVFRHILTLPGGHSILNTHVVNLLNHTPDGRNALNTACERIWMKLGVLKPEHGSVTVRYNFALYPGAKITFTQNYNKPIRVTFGGKKSPNAVVCVSDPVANGELAIVRKIYACKFPARGIVMEIVDSEDPADMPETKRIWIDMKEGVKPTHIDLGYSTTVYKTQGREFDRVIFWNQPFPGEQWTRANAYVAVSRGKQRVWISGTPKDFFTICNQREPPRKTCFRELLLQHTFQQKNEPFVYDDTEFPPAAGYTLMSKDELASPVMQQQTKKD